MKMADIMEVNRTLKVFKDLSAIQASIPNIDGIISVTIDNISIKRPQTFVHMRRKSFLDIKKACGLETEVTTHSGTALQEQAVLFDTVRVFSLLDKEEYIVDINIIPKEVAI